MTRALLVLLCVVLVAAGLLGMRRGWRNRLARQSGLLPPLPELPRDLGPALLAGTGLYVGSTFAGSWQDRVLHGGLGERADATATLHERGLLVERQGSSEVFVPRELWREARLAPGLAGMVVGEGGLLVLRWQLGPELVDTGFRADDKSTYPQWVRTINGKVVV
ncbi:MAG TPA: transporter [Jatrophihabitans sp.]|nr:transporter [Jatrophihabitans sp.]